MRSHLASGRLDCFAALAMTAVRGLLRCQRLGAQRQAEFIPHLQQRFREVIDQARRRDRATA